jgi:hypothetical protein
VIYIFQWIFFREQSEPGLKSTKFLIGATIGTTVIVATPLVFIRKLSKKIEKKISSIPLPWLLLGTLCIATVMKKGSEQYKFVALPSTFVKSS